VISPQKLPKRLLLLFLLVLGAAGILSPAGAASWHASGFTPFAHQKGAGKGAARKHCRQRPQKARRGCRSGADRRRHKKQGSPATPGLPPHAVGSPPPRDDFAPEEEGFEPEDAEEAEEEEVEGEVEGEAEEETEGEAEEEEASEDGEELGASAARLPSPPHLLRWAPPPLVEPKTIILGDGYSHPILATNRDYIIKLPPTKKIGGTWIDGGHNVVIKGGHVTVPAGTSASTANERTAISIRGATGTVHVEGVLIDGSGGGEFDGVTINAPEAVVQLQNMRIVGVRGREMGFHGDVIQPWGGVKDLRIDYLTGTSNYQGLSIQQDLGPIGSAKISHADLVATTEPTVERGGHMLWLTKGGVCNGYPLALSEVFVKPRRTKTLGGSVWPQSDSSLPCKASVTTFATWPGLPVSGAVQSGVPSGGNFVPSGVAGLSYQSPGYLIP
jgi:hypothetical protein